VVITSVDRDDMDDGGAAHWVAVITAVQAANPDTTIEVLTPDFRKKMGMVDLVAAAKPDVYNHNLETVPRLYRKIRASARYYTSLRCSSGSRNSIPCSPNPVSWSDLAKSAKKCFRSWTTCVRPMSISSRSPISSADAAPCDLERFVTPDEFAEYERIARAKGFLMVSATPLTRSSYHADADFARLKARAAKRSSTSHFNSDAGASARPGSAIYAGADVRSCRRRGALSGISALVRGLPHRQPSVAERFFTADLAIGFKMVREQFTSRVRLEPKTKINVDYLKGPFQHLRNGMAVHTGRRGGADRFFSLVRIPLAHVAGDYRHAVRRGGATYGRGLRDPGP